MRLSSLMLVSFMVGLFLVALVPAQTRSDIVPVITYTMQPTGSDSLHWSFGKYLTQGRNGSAKPARGIEVASTSSGGNFKIHLINDYDSKGRKIWLVYPIPASSGSTQRIGLIFDEVDSAGTTILKTDVTNWY